MPLSRLTKIVIAFGFKYVRREKKKEKNRIPLFTESVEAVMENKMNIITSEANKASFLLIESKAREITSNSKTVIPIKPRTMKVCKN